MLGALWTSCGAADEPSWTRLAELPTSVSVSASSAEQATAQRRFRGPDGKEWIEVEIPRAEWRAMDRPGGWRAPAPLRSLGRGLDSSAQLGAGTRTFTQLHAQDQLKKQSTADTFTLLGEWVMLQLAAGEEPPERVHLTVEVQRRSSEGGRARVDGRRFSGDGFSVWAGERVELIVDLPPASVLRTATVVEAMLSAEGERSSRFRIELDGQALLAHEQAEAPEGTLERHVLPLPVEGRRGARLAFEVEGGLAATSFLEPVIGPANGGARSARPNILLFVADTFRADNLGVYGSSLGITPNLDALAAESLRFSMARSVGTYTLPAHASLFSGEYPGQVAVDAFNRSLPDEVVTLAERFSAAGYRTGAITGAVIVSHVYGMSQGFATFDELRGGMDSTRARVESFLSAEDGRPTFLLVHTYRVHSPYQPSAAGRALLEQRTGRHVGGEFRTLATELESILRQTRDQAIPARARELAADLEFLYRACVADFDGEFARLLADPAVRGLLENGFLVFTSDHGEAFLEHGELYHAGSVHEEQLAIPLLLRGPGIEAGVRSEPVSLIDLAPTLIDLVGLPGATSWSGQSLRQPPVREQLYAFECREDRPATLAVFAARRKLIGLVEQRERTVLPPRAAYDLALDPREENDLLTSGATWPGELDARLRQTVDELLRPRVASSAAELDREQREALEDLGYAGR